MRRKGGYEIISPQTEFLEQLFRSDETDARLVALKAYLRDRGWVTARDITAALGYTDRMTRAIAEASDGDILSGQSGYKITSQATPEEVAEATGRLESQAKKMSLRACAIRRTWHSSCKHPA